MGFDSYSENILEDYDLGGLAGLLTRATRQYEDIKNIKEVDFIDASFKKFGEGKMKMRI